MINLNAYDNIVEIIDKKKTWTNVSKKQILSRELKYKKYAYICKRYNNITNIYSYFIILLDEKPYDKTIVRTKRDNYGRIKINIGSIWNETSLSDLSKDINITIKLVDEDDDSIVYQLDI